MDKMWCQSIKICNYGIVALEKKMQLYVIPMSHVENISFGLV